MVYRDQQELANQDCGCLPINYYAMTEMMTFTFHSLHMDFASRDFQSHSRDEKIRAFQATREGSAFADLIRSILETGNVSRLLWGQVAEFNNEIVILIDWSDHPARTLLYASDAFITAKTKIRQLLTQDIELRAFNIQNASSRNECFGRSASEGIGTVPLDTAFYIWRFPTNIRDLEIIVHSGADDYEMVARPEVEFLSTTEYVEDQEIVAPPHPEHPNPDEAKAEHARTFETHWNHFCLQYYRRCAPPPLKMSSDQRGIHRTQHPPWGGGWEVPLSPPSEVDNGDTFCGVIGTYRDFHRGYLARKVECAYEDGGIGELRSIASDGLDVFHVELHCLKTWRGSLLPP